MSPERLAYFSECVRRHTNIVPSLAAEALAHIQEQAAELEGLSKLASIARDAATTFMDWRGMASTMQAADDSMYRLNRALDAAGLKYNGHDALAWRGSVLKELNDAGFFFSEAKDRFVFDPDAETARPYRNHGNALGPTLAEVATRFAALRETMP